MQVSENGEHIFFYRLDENHQPVPEPDEMVFWHWKEDGGWHVKTTFIGETKVSTVFLGFDINHRPGGVPLLFETMVFGGEFDAQSLRSSSWEEALIAHAVAVHFIVTLTRLESRPDADSS